jgi:hypothetical protein
MRSIAFSGMLDAMRPDESPAFCKKKQAAQGEA